MTPQHLRQLADRTGLDGIAEALREAADEIERMESIEQAARNVLGWIEASHRPPVRDVIEFGRSVSVRLHALADLQTAIDAARKDTK